MKNIILLFIVLGLYIRVSAQTEGPELYWEDKTEGDHSMLLCNLEGKSFTVDVYLKRGATAFKNGTYTLDYGNGDKKENLEEDDFPWRIEYKTAGQYTLTFSAQQADGTRVSTQYTVRTVKRPEIALLPASTDVQCVGTEISYLVQVADKNTAATTYTLNYDDGTFDVMTNDELKAAHETFKHVYNMSYCSEEHMGSSRNFFKVSLSVNNECGSNFQVGMSYEEKVAEPIRASFTFSELDAGYGCTFSPVRLHNTTGGGNDVDCSQTNIKWDWDFGNNKHSIERNPSITYQEAKEAGFKIRLIATNGYECARDTAYGFVAVVDQVVADFNILTDVVCSGETLRFVNKSHGGGNMICQWKIIPEGGRPMPEITNGDYSSVHPEIFFNNWGKYRVELRVSNGCSTAVKDTLIVVNQDPDILRFDIPEAMCPPRLDFSEWVSVNWNGNDEQPKWTITREGATPNTGFTTVEGAGLASTYPVIDFVTPGVYTVTLELPGKNCGGTRLKGSKKITVYDPDIHTEVSASELDLCENGVVNFENHSVGKGLHYQWSVSPASAVSFAGGTRYTDASPAIQFNKFGDYEVNLHLTSEGGCGSADTLFKVHVKKEPHIFYFNLPAAICPDEIIDFSEKIIYQFFNNDEKAEWTITPTDGLEFLDGTSMTSPYPKICFRKPATDYTFTVKIEHKGCSMEGVIQQATKKVRVRASAMTLKASATDTLICEGEEIGFSMNAASAEGDPLVYNWSITPTDESYDFGFIGNQAEVANITFNHWGIYQVRAEASGYCGTLDSIITVRVKKDPEVRLRDTSGICPGIMDLADYADFQWFGNEKKVVWKITPASSGTPADGFEFAEGDGNSLYPKIRFKSKGEYSLNVRLETVDCGGGYLEATRIYSVYDTTIRVDMNPLSSTDICEGEKVRFRNMNEGVGLRHHWSITGPADGYTYEEGTDEHSPAPVLLFTKYGEYDLTVDIEGTCNAKRRIFHVTVRGIPGITLVGRIPKMCAGSDAVDMSEYVVYTDRKNCDIVPEWTLFPESGYAFVDGYGENTDFPRINFQENANYTVTLKVTAQCGTPWEGRLKVDVIKSGMEPAFDLPEETCVPLVVEVNDLTEGDSLSYVWSVAAHTASGGGWEYQAPDDEHSLEPHLNFTEQGTYDVTLAVTNICGTKSVMHTIRAYAVPVVHAGDISRVCERFELAMADTVKVEENNDALRRALWTITPEGAFKDGFTKESLFPELSFEHGAYHVKAEFWNGCADPGIGEFDVLVDEFIPVEPLLNDTLCHLEPELELVATPAGGKWELAGAEDLLGAKEGKTVFNPARPGEYELVYSFTNGSCIASNTKKIKVHALPVVHAGADLGMCLNHDPRTLTGLPDGGWWEGEGIVSPVFTPRYPGEVTLQYYFKDEHQCTNRDSMVMSVYALPDTAFVAQDQYCRGAEAEFEVVSREEKYIWDYGDATKEDTTAGNGKHVYEIHGFYDVQLVAVSEQGCLDTSDLRKIEVVNDAPQAAFTLDKHAGCGPDVEVNITVNPALYTDPNLKFAWDFGNGTISDRLLPENPQVYQCGLWDTTYAIAFKVYNICNTTDSVDHLTVGSVPKAGLEFQHKWNCSPLSLRVKNISTGDHNRYTWYMGDGTLERDVYEPREHLYESDEGTQVFDISLVARNTCGKDSISKPLTVLAQTLEAFFETPKNNICVGEEICFTNHTTDSVLYVSYKYWDFGDEVRDTAWNACHSYREAGDYQVLLYVDNGCGFDTISDRIKVLPLPQITLESEGAVCDRDTFHFNFQTDQQLQWWQWTLGDELQSLDRDLGHTFQLPGDYVIGLDVISNNIAFCKARAEKTITVHPRPVLAVSPFDTLVCPPWTYLPQVTGNAYSMMWDYGDGSELTSSLEHLYKNETDSVEHHQVILHAESDKGCPEDFIGNIAVSNLPVAGMQKEVVHGRPQKVTLVNISKDYTECVWYLPPDRVDHTFDDRHLEFMENGVHEFSLVTYNQYGCKDSVSLEHEVMMKGLYFPNTFIPHSLNGKVNRFNGIGMGLQRYKLEIFDQYYNKIWETQALINGKPSEGWDGCNMKGERMPQGNYIWRAEAIFADDEVWTGKNNESGVPQKMQGTVLLLRE